MNLRQSVNNPDMLLIYQNMWLLMRKSACIFSKRLYNGVCKFLFHIIGQIFTKNFSVFLVSMRFYSINLRYKIQIMAYLFNPKMAYTEHSFKI